MLFTIPGGRHRGNFQKREGAALNSGSDAAGSRKRWGAKRSSERFDTLDEIRIPVKLGRISDSNVMKSSTFQGFQLRRRGLEETEAEGKLLLYTVWVEGLRKSSLGLYTSLHLRAGACI